MSSARESSTHNRALCSCHGPTSNRRQQRAGSVRQPPSKYRRTVAAYYYAVAHEAATGKTQVAREKFGPTTIFKPLGNSWQTRRTKQLSCGRRLGTASRPDRGGHHAGGPQGALPPSWDVGGVTELPLQTTRAHVYAPATGC